MLLPLLEIRLQKQPNHKKPFGSTGAAGIPPEGTRFSEVVIPLLSGWRQT
jgi:hypothetical protein